MMNVQIFVVLLLLLITYLISYEKSSDTMSSEPILNDEDPKSMGYNHDIKRNILANKLVPSGYVKNVVHSDCCKLAKKDPYLLNDPFEEVREIYGHGYSPYDYKINDERHEPAIKFPSKRNIDIYGGNYFLPAMPSASCEFSNEPTPLDSENVFSRDNQEYRISQVHPLKDVPFLVAEN